MDPILISLNWYAEHGFPCFPCAPGEKTPLTKHGFRDATLDLRRVAEWLEAMPDANWAIACGDVAGRLLVVDIDPRHGGEESWDLLRQQHPEPLETVCVRTPSGGQHLWFRYPEGLEINSRAGAIAPGIDHRCNGGYVLVPPSHINGVAYHFELPPTEAEIADAPEWLLALLTAQPRTPVVVIGDSIPEGQRNATLAAQAGAMRRAGLGLEAIQAGLLEQNARRCLPPLPDVEVIGIALSIAGYTPSGISHRSDLGNAERFVAAHGHEVRYVTRWAKWLLWDGRWWKIDSEAEVRRRAHATVLSIYGESELGKDTREREELARWAMASESRFRIDAMLNEAKAMSPVAISPDELDRDDWLLNVQNGIVDLRTGDLMPHDPGRMITKLAPVTFDESAACPRWHAFLDLVTGGRETLAQYIQRAVGYSLTGTTDEHKVFFPFGGGGNGKTTFLETMRQLWGDYFTTTNIEALMAGPPRGEGATPNVAALRGARFVVAAEIPEGRRLNESLLKSLTGGDYITARFLYAEPFTFRPTHKLWIVGNFQPRVNDTSYGFWRRMKVVPFTVTIGPERARAMSEVLAEFAEEAPGILGWAVAGCLAWQHARLDVDEPAVVQGASDEYRRAQDTVEEFVNEECDTHPDYQALKGDLFDRFVAWARRGNEDVQRCSKRWLTTQLMRRGCRQGADGAKSPYLLGIRLKAPA